MARVHRKAAVIPYRIRKERVEVALVTTSSGKGWIVPKGSVDEGELRARRGDSRSRGGSRSAGRCPAQAARPLPPHQRQSPLSRRGLLDARHQRARPLARGPAAPPAVDAYPGCRGVPARRAAAVRPRHRERGRTGLLRPCRTWTSSRHAQPNPRTSSEVTSHRTRSRGACRRSCRRATVRSSGTGSPLLDTFDGRVRRAGARLTQRGVNGTSTVGWQTRRRRKPRDGPAEAHGQLRLGSSRRSAPAGRWHR